MLKMNSYINIKCCSDDLCNTFDESAWWPPGDAVHWSPVVAPQPTWAADEWRSTFNEDNPALSKNWTNKTIEKRSLWCLWMHFDCLGMVWHGFTLGQATDKSLEIHGCGLVSSVRYKADNLRFITRMTLLTDARDSKWCWKKKFHHSHRVKQLISQQRECCTASQIIRLPFCSHIIPYQPSGYS